MSATQRPKRIGMITPSSNTAIEPITQAVCLPLLDRVTTHYSRVRVVHNALAESAQGQFDPSFMLPVSELLGDAHMDAIIWNGTSAGWLGLERDRRLCAAIEDRTGIPTGSAFLAQIEAMRLLGAERYVMVSPYVEDMNQAIAATLEAEGFHCVHAHGLGVTENIKLGDITRDELRDHVLEQARDADAILIPCTNYAVSWVVQELEDELGIPIVDSILLAIWEGLRIAGVPTPIEGWGRFMRQRWDGTP